MAITLDDCEKVLNYMSSDEGHKKCGFELKVVDVEKVSGGLANYVYRLVFEDKSTAIFKHYSNQLKAISEAQFSPKRYFIEKSALKILGEEESLKECRISTPKLLYADDDMYIIIMQDCGRSLVTLSDFLKKDYELPESMRNGKSNEEQNQLIDDMIDLTAKEIRNFLIKLATEVSIRPETHQDPFSNEPFWDGATHAFGTWLPAMIKGFELEKEFDQIMTGFDGNIRPPPGDLQFVHGDFWPNSMLLDLEKRTIWLLDWEMSRFDTKSKDLSQMCMFLWIFKRTPAVFDTARSARLLKRLHLEYYGDENADWLEKSEPLVKRFFPIGVMFLMAWKDQFGWDLKNPRENILEAIVKSQTP